MSDGKGSALRPDSTASLSRYRRRGGERSQRCCIRRRACLTRTEASASASPGVSERAALKSGETGFEPRPPSPQPEEATKRPRRKRGLVTLGDAPRTLRDASRDNLVTLYSSAQPQPVLLPQLEHV